MSASYIISTKRKCVGNGNVGRTRFYTLVAACNVVDRSLPNQIFFCLYFFLCSLPFSPFIHTQHTHTHTHTHTQTKYHNSHCACTLRVQNVMTTALATDTLETLQPTHIISQSQRRRVYGHTHGYRIPYGVQL